jgi:uncharacterized SAM-binding protein YcdF (DUF218 family)
LTGESVWAGPGFVKQIQKAPGTPRGYERRPLVIPLSTRLGPARFLDPLLLTIVALGVLLYLASRGSPAVTVAAQRARRALWALWGGLWVLSTPFVGGVLTMWTETRGPDLGTALAGLDREKVALVVLSGGLRTRDQSSPPRERLDTSSTQRVLTASRLWKEQGFGLVILSGAPPAETEGMRDLMTTLGVPPAVIVLEDRSLNTRENAAYSATILRERRQETVVVVTSATHLRRAVKDFAAVGITAIPAAADVYGPPPRGIDSFLPSAHGLARTQTCLHELLGYVRG